MIRLAVLVPMSNLAVEPEFYKMAPEGIAIHFARISSTPPLSPSPEQWSKEIRSSLDAMGQDAPRVAKEFSIRRDEIKILALACTSGSFHRGIEHERDLVHNMEEASGIPSITTSGAVVKALQELKMKRLCLISPYAPYSHERAIDFLVANGFEVIASKGLGLQNIEHSLLPPEVSRDLALATCPGVDCDGIFSSCTAFRTVEILDEVEKEIGKPMVSANQATMWLMLKKAGVKEPISGFGTLMRHL
ncbi:maleate cis-trans isomerase [Chloroflexota bacterium]